MDRKACQQCGITFENTPQNFHKSKDGLHARCKRCRNQHEKGTRTKVRANKLGQIEKGAVDIFVAAAQIGGANIPHSSELLEKLMQYCGGVGGFSNIFMKQYYDSPPGGAFRTKLLDTIVRLTQANTAIGGAKKPLVGWTEEELEDELRVRLTDMAMTLKALPPPVVKND